MIHDPSLHDERNGLEFMTKRRFECVVCSTMVEEEKKVYTLGDYMMIMNDLSSLFSSLGLGSYAVQ
jgi:hypothetical protein